MNKWQEMEGGKNVLVTGASRGIGRATALELARNGYTVAVHYFENREEANTTLSMLQGEGHFICQADLSKTTDVKRLFKRLDEKFERLDRVVNNAGVAIHHKLELEVDEWFEVFQKNIDVNLYGAALVCHYALKRMMEEENGIIVNVSSRGAFRGEPDMPGYGAGKAGLNSLTQSLAKAAGEHGVSVVAVAPGFVETDMSKKLLADSEHESVKAQSPLNRIAQPEEVAKLIAFLCRSESKHLSGAIVDINGASYFR